MGGDLLLEVTHLQQVQSTAVQLAERGRSQGVALDDDQVVEVDCVRLVGMRPSVSAASKEATVVARMEMKCDSRHSVQCQLFRRAL